MSKPFFFFFSYFTISLNITPYIKCSILPYNTSKQPKKKSSYNINKTKPMVPPKSPPPPITHPYQIETQYHQHNPPLPQTTTKHQPKSTNCHLKITNHHNHTQKLTQPPPATATKTTTTHQNHINPNRQKNPK